jgi:protoporphyrinogen oxidase
MSIFTILGAGLSGLSSSYHLGHHNCEIFEKNEFVGGHINTEIIEGFTWDEGPHVSFTKLDYVKQLLANSVNQEFLEYPVNTACYFKGSWIPHPAQSNLFAIPQPIRENCLKDFLLSRNQLKNGEIKNYEEWLIAAFGKTFYEYFPKAYTQKYWTVEPKLLSIDWVGERIFFPNIEDVKNGYFKPLESQTHYITEVRYPKHGGYMSFASKVKLNAKVNLKHELKSISFKNKKIVFSNGIVRKYVSLISTLPLPELIAKSDAPKYVKAAAERLSCSSVLLINVTANHPTLLSYNWMYVYDEDKFCTRINCTEKLSPNNAPSGKTGIQIEVYFSKYKEKLHDDKYISEKVIDELIEMRILGGRDNVINYHTKWVKWANVIFDFNRKESLNIIFEYLEKFGLKRHNQDLLPMTDWSKFKRTDGVFQLVGRYAEWKYFWTDDCIMTSFFNTK